MFYLVAVNSILKLKNDYKKINEGEKICQRKFMI